MMTKNQKLPSEYVDLMAKKNWVSPDPVHMRDSWAAWAWLL